MRQREFESRLETLKVGDYVKLCVRGNYGNYFHKGRLVKVENGRVHLDNGKAHSYRRILSIGLTVREP